MFRKAIILLLAVSAMAVLSGCREIEPGTTEREPGKAVRAQVLTAELLQKPSYYEAVETIRAELSSTLAAKLLGEVKKVHVREGDMVKQGDLLVELDPRQVEARLNRATASLAEAERGFSAALSVKQAAASQEELATATFKRYQKLREDESVSRQEFDEVRNRQAQAAAALDQARDNVEAARSRVDQAKAGVEEARAMEKDSLVRAPYDGAVTAKLVEEGDMAAPGAPLLALEGHQGFRADILLPEMYVAGVTRGQEVRVSVPGLAVPALDGTVEVVVPNADAKSRSFLVQVSIPDAEGLRSGMFARVSVPVGESGLLLIPATAVVLQGQLDGYFQVDETGVARFRLLRTGRAFGDKVEVLSGLASGERFVADPPPGLTNGDRVEEGS